MFERTNWIWLLIAVPLLALVLAVPVGGRKDTPPNRSAHWEELHRNHRSG